MGQTETKKLGDLLRQQREQKNLSLKEVENATSIRINYLKAIEDGEMEKVISPVYAQGFVKQYGFFLGFDGEQLVKECESAFCNIEKQEFSYGIGTLEQRNAPKTATRWIPGLLYTVATVGILTLAWYFARYLGVL